MDRKPKPEGEHRGAVEFLHVKYPKGRRNSLVQADGVHLSPMLPHTAPAPAGLSRQDFEKLRNPKNGEINAHALTGLLHPSFEKHWNPDLGGGRHQIRTGRNFEVPDIDNPGQSFKIRIHTNDNTRTEKAENAHSRAVARIEHVITNNHSRFLMGGRSHSGVAGEAAWVRNADDEESNAAHIPLKFPKI
jgi:hypothetical protein